MQDPEKNRPPKRTVLPADDDEEEDDDYEDHIEFESRQPGIYLSTKWRWF